LQEHIVGLRDPKSLAEKDGSDSGGGPSGSGASPAAVTLALLLTDEELDSLEKRAGDGEIALRGRQVDQMSRALNRL
jgi:hypothetical protein